MNHASVLLCALSSPLLLGVYHKESLCLSLSHRGKCSDGLVQLWKQALEFMQSHHYNLEKIILARGPGSWMGIKLSYIFAQSIAIAQNIEIVGIDGFMLNDNNPIFAYGQSYFVKKGNEIIVQNKQAIISSEQKPTLPQSLHQLSYSSQTSPLYILPAIKEDEW